MLNSRIILSAILLTVEATASAATLSNVQRENAVKKTVETAPECKRLGDFYWEIGDGRHVIASQSIGTTYTSDKSIHIASASKWIFGSYVLEKIGKHTEPSMDQIRALEMQSGYTSLKFGACIFSRTVADCFTRRENDLYSPSAAGHFFYNGGHDQKLAVDLGLGNLDAAQFGVEIRKYLGTDLDIDFNSPQPAGGMRATPDAYAQFLRKILSGELRMKDYLGSNPVCTLPGACPNAIESPVPVAWHYSLNHWIEDDPENGDGAFSSPGAFGFYPWISADKQWYGILARESHKPMAYKESVYCGAKMRKSWETGLSR